MFRTVIALLAAACAAPLHAHEGMSLHGPLHLLLHTLGTETVIALAGTPLVILAVVVLLRIRRAAAAPAKSAQLR